MRKGKSTIIVAILISILTFSAIPLFTTSSAALSPTDLAGTLNGASYRIQIPNPIETWNRNLVIYCHGYSHTEPQPPLSMASASTLVAAGWAVAMSSYGMGGYFIKTAMENTYLLTQYVKNTYNVTGKIFLLGISQGGGISLLLAEKYPNLYNGVLDLSGSKDLKLSYQTRIDQLSARNDAELTAKLQAIGASVPPYPYASLADLQTFNVNQKNDLENATGGTPDTVPKAYEEISATYHANIHVPVITIHALYDPVNTYAQALAYQAAVASAGKSSFYRLYTTSGTGHVDSTVTSQVPTRFAELVSWAATLQDWNMTIDSRSLKAYLDLKETVWVKNATMAPNGQYDKIGLHRLVKTGITPKGVVFLTNCPTWGTGESRISNPAGDSFTKTENSSQAIYWANKGFDVYAIDYRTHFVPKDLNASQMAFAATWGLDVWVSDIKEAADKVKVVSGADKFFISGECTGAMAALNYATKYWKTDLKGIILLDANFFSPGYPVVGKAAESNNINLTSTVNAMNAGGTWSYNPFGTLAPIASYALQNPSAPAQYPPGTPLSPATNPFTNRTWANISEWFSVSMQNNFGNVTAATPSGMYSNLMGGYNSLSQVEYIIANTEFLPYRIQLEANAMVNWANCPYLTYDYNDHYSEIGVPVIAFESSLFANRTGTLRFVNGIASTDFTGIMLANYGHLDVYTGTYSARDVSEPAFQWMVGHISTLDVTARTSVTVISGWTWYFYAQNLGGNGPFTYQWYEGLNPIQGQTGMVLPMTKAAPGVYSFYCRVTDKGGTTTTSNYVTLTVIG